MYLFYKPSKESNEPRFKLVTPYEEIVTKIRGDSTIVLTHRREELEPKNDFKIKRSPPVIDIFKNLEFGGNTLDLLISQYGEKLSDYLSKTLEWRKGETVKGRYAAFLQVYTLEDLRELEQSNSNCCDLEKVKTYLTDRCSVNLDFSKLDAVTAQEKARLIDGLSRVLLANRITLI